MSNRAEDLLLKWLLRQLAGEQKDWLTAQLTQLESDQSSRAFDIMFGMIPRKLGKADLDLSEDDFAEAHNMREGWDPHGWSVDIAARVLILLKVSPGKNTPFAARFKDLHSTAELSELIALYYGLPLYDEPETLVDQATHGLRTNMRSEFEAIAHHNPFPAEQFEQNPWNNMVLKALFIGAMLNPIQGLDDRANPELARILRDYAHERWAAGRAVSPELWRCIGPFAEAEFLDDFQRVLDDGVETEKKAIALALKAAPASARRDEMAIQLGDYGPAIEDGTLTWATVAEEMLDNALAVTARLNTEVELTR